jgi:tellurite resistance protein
MNHVQDGPSPDTLPAMELKIGKDTLIALAAVGWADGTMAPEEAAGIRAAARQLSLTSADAEAVEEAIKSRVDMTEVETIRMDRVARLFTYAVASWIATVDGKVTAEEQGALKVLGDRLGLSAVARERAQTVGLAVGQVSSSIEAYDLVKLKSRLSTGLSQIGNE